MHGQLQGGHMKNRRVTVFRMDKENEKCIIQKKKQYNPHLLPHPLATLPFPIPTPTGCIIFYVYQVVKLL